MNNNKNKLNNKIILIFNLYSNTTTFFFLENSNIHFLPPSKTNDLN